MFLHCPLEFVYKDGPLINPMEISLYHYSKRQLAIRHMWFMPVIVAIQEAEIRRTTVQSQPRQIVLETLS
jgi:hypothetical protein